MSSYTFFDLLKAEAKDLAHDQGIKLSEAQQIVAINSGFAHFHEMTVVGKSNPNDPRMMSAALGVANLEEAIFEDTVFSELESAVDNSMVSETANTNAFLYRIEDLEASKVDYDDSTGILTLDVSFIYSGEHDPDSVYWGSKFYVEAVVWLTRRSGKWLLADEGVDITKAENDFFTDY